MEVLRASFRSLESWAHQLTIPSQLVYVCWLAFEIVFIWLYLVETKNVSPFASVYKLPSSTNTLYPLAHSGRDRRVRPTSFFVTDDFTHSRVYVG